MPVTTDGGSCVKGAARDEFLLLGRHEDVPGRFVEELRQDVEIDGRILLGGRDEDGAVRDERQPEVRRKIAKGIEEDQIEIPPVGAEVLEQSGRLGTILVEPLLLPLARRAALEDLVAEIGERFDSAGTGHRKAENAARRSQPTAPGPGRSPR